MKQDRSANKEHIDTTRNLIRSAVEDWTLLEALGYSPDCGKLLIALLWACDRAEKTGEFDVPRAVADIRSEPGCNVDGWDDEETEDS